MISFSKRAENWGGGEGGGEGGVGRRGVGGVRRGGRWGGEDGRWGGERRVRGEKRGEISKGNGRLGMTVIGSSDQRGTYHISQ